MKHFTKIFSVFFLFALTAKAQDTQMTISNLKAQTGAAVSLNNFGTAEFVRFQHDNALVLNGNSLKEKALAFLSTYKSIYKIGSIEETLVFKNNATDNYGLKQVVFNQVYKGVPVFDGQLRFHFNANNELTAINGNYIPEISKLSTATQISPSEARNIAIETVNTQNLNGSGKPLETIAPVLYVFPKGLIQDHVTSLHLAYEVEVKNELDVREFIYVDAHNGTVVEQFTGIAHALNRRLYEGNTSNLIWQEGDAFPGALTIWQQNEVEVSRHVYNFFNNAFGYVSFNNADATMHTINNNPNISCPNANWNGYTVNYCDGTASDDVVAHEWGHAYTQYTSGLIYAYQSGAINESYSDIWGETVDLINQYQDEGENLTIRTLPFCNSHRWKIGEDASAFNGAIRDMWNPPCNGNPGRVTDNWYWCSESDSGGVHINSGIPNHAYALLVDGGTYNGYTIAGIGFTKAAHIFWRAQSTYLTPTSNFGNLADALEASAMDLLGINLEGLSTEDAPAGLSGEAITTADLESLANAIFAVELRINPDACGFATILSPIAPLCEAATSNPLYIENWESGMGAWTVEQLPVHSSTWESRDWALNSTLPGGRTGTAIFGADPINGNCSSDLQNGIIRLQSPVITIPNITEGTFSMSFDHYIATEKQWDGGNIKYRHNNGLWTILPSSAFLENPYNSFINTASAGNDNPMQGQVAFTGTDGGSLSGSWGTSVINLSALNVVANSTIQFRFEFGTDGCNGNDGWYIDDIVIFNCATPLSIDESNILKNKVMAYPNPSNGVFKLKKTAMIDLVKAEIFDINGRLVKTIDLSGMQTELDIDMSDATPGMYLMSLDAKDAKTVFKLIKQ
ncbi:MAG TPA: M4 family metallopeptidase [Aquaticitalea sp.]|nr:M4 family metallopeptidase [Aquaticitalea sp.]